VQELKPRLFWHFDIKKNCIKMLASRQMFQTFAGM
jgi:hypothetical protein